MHLQQFSFLCVYTAWRETHLALKYLRGEWKDGRDACRGHSFYPGHRKRNIGLADKENATFSTPWHLTSSNWCLVWNRQKEVMNVLLWHKDKPSGHCGVSAPKHTNWFAFFKVHRARCLFLFIFFQIKRGWRKFVSVYCCRDNRLHTSRHFYNHSLCYFSQSNHIKIIFNDTAWVSQYIHQKLG